MPGALFSIKSVPKHCQHQRVEPVLRVKLQLCLFPRVKRKRVTWSHRDHTVQTGILYCSNASNQFIFFIKIIYTEGIVSLGSFKFYTYLLSVKEKRIK